MNGQTPDASLQEFRRLRKYFRDGRAPWTLKDGRIGFLTRGAPTSAFDLPVSANAFGDILRERFRSELIHEATNGHAERSPLESARSVRITVGPRLTAAVALCLAVAAAFPEFVMLSVAAAAAGLFILVAGARLALAAIAQAPAAPAPRKRLADRDLPVVTILAPLFREGCTLPGLALAIDRLNYPRSKLDVKLLLEECDGETLAEARRLELDRRCELIVIPPSHPQTKPKACNYGLQCARGDLIVIYDAEDEPEADQLPNCRRNIRSRG